jgi:hypothetical protein
MKRRQILTTGPLTALAATFPFGKSEASSFLPENIITLDGHLRKEIPFDFPPDLAKVESVYKADLWIYSAPLACENQRSGWGWSYGNNHPFYEKCFADDIAGDFDNAKMENVNISTWEWTDDEAFCDRLGINLIPRQYSSVYEGTISDLMVYRHWSLQRLLNIFLFDEEQGTPIALPTFNEIWVRCLDGWAFYIEQIQREQDSPGPLSTFSCCLITDA